MNSDLENLSNSEEKFKKGIKLIGKTISSVTHSNLSKSPQNKSNANKSLIVNDRYNNPETFYLGYIKQKPKDNKKQNETKDKSPSVQKSINQSLSQSPRKDAQPNFKIKAQTQQNWHSPQIKSPLIDMLNYEFYSSNQEFTNRQILQLFQKSQENEQENKKKLQRLLMQLICTQVMDKMKNIKLGVEDEDDGLPEVYHKNRLHWLQLLITKPRIQKFHCNMANALDRLISSELINSNKVFKTYIKNEHLTNLAHQQVSFDFQKLTQIPQAPMPKVLRDQITSNSEKKSNLDYFKVKDYNLEQILDERVEQGLEQAKFNYQKIKQQKRKRQMQMTGSLKHFNDKTSKQFISDDKFSLQVKHTKDGKTQIQFEEYSPEKKKILKDQTEEEKQAYDKFLRIKYKDQLLTDFQKKLLQSTERVKSLVETIDVTNVEMLTAVKQTNQDLEDLEAEREQYSQSIPGDKLHSLVRQWAADHVYSPEDMKTYASELWLSLQEFEKQINEEERHYLVRYKDLQDKYQSHISHIQRQTQFRIEAYESAFIQVKFESNRQIDRLNMQLADIESKELYDHKDIEKNTNELISKAEEGLVLRNTLEARTIINQFVTALKINMNQYENLQTKNDKTNKSLDMFETRLQDKDAFYVEEKKLRKFYQKTLIKMVRELNLFEDDIEKKQKFELINEEEDDLNYQRQVSFVLQTINLQQACIDHTNKYFGQKEGIIKIQNNLNQIGIINKPECLTTSEDSEDNDLNERTFNIEPVQTINKKGVKQVTQNPLQATNKKTQLKQQSIAKATEILSPQGRDPQSDALHQFVKDQERKKLKKEALKQLQTALKDAMEGNLEIPVSTEDSGAPNEINTNDLRQKLTQLIAEESPEMLQDFRFDKDREEIMPTPVKPEKKKPKNKESDSKLVLKKKKESTAISLTSKKDEDVAKKVVKQETKIEQKHDVVDKPIVQQIKKPEEKKELVVNEIKEQGEKLCVVCRREIQQKDTDLIQKSIKKTGVSSFKIQANDLMEEDDKSEKSLKVKKTDLQSLKQEPKISQDDNFMVQESIIQPSITVQTPLIQTPLTNQVIKQTQELTNLEKVITPKSQQVDLNATMQSQPVQESVSGIILIQQELTKLYDKKFSKILQNNSNEIEEIKKMKAVQINQMQDFVERSLGIQLPYGERMELFQGEITNFFQKLNELIVKQYNFAKIHQFIAKGEQLETKKETKLERQKTESDLKKISFGNFLKPNFSPSGELMGFELRHELVAFMFQFNDKQQNILKRAIKACLYMNRLLINGQSCDFLLKQFKDGEKVEEVDLNKKYVDAECQVDLIELHNNRQTDENSKEESEIEEEDVCEQLLRDFGVGMMVRMDPTNVNKRNYYDMIFSNLSGHRLLGYYLEDIFLTMEDRSKNRKITLQKMFENFQDQVFNIVYGIEVLQRKQLITEKMLSLSVGYMQTEKTFRETDVQATVQTRSIMSYTGNELMHAFMAKGQLLIRKTKNNLILDKAMEDEFKMTLDMFDQFAQQLSKLESEAQKKIELENMDNDSTEGSKYKRQNASKKKLKANKFLGNDKNEQKVQSVRKIQDEITGLIVNVQKSGALTSQVDEINYKEQKKQSPKRLTSNAQFMFSNEESLTSLTQDKSGYIQNPLQKNFNARNLQTAQSIQVQGNTNSMKQPFVTSPSVNLKKMKAGLKLAEETDPIRIAATKKFNAILRQKLAKIMIKNQNNAIQIDRILNSSTEMQNGFSSHFNSIDGMKHGFNTTSMYESMMAGIDLDIFKKSRRTSRKQIFNKPSGIASGPGELKNVSQQNTDLGLNKSLDQASQVNFENIETEQPEVTIQINPKGSRNSKLIQYHKSTITNSKNVDMIKSKNDTDQSTNSILNTNDMISTYKLQQAEKITPMTIKAQKFQDKLNTAMLYRQSEIQRKVLNYDSAMAEITQVPNYLLTDSFYSKKNRIDNSKTNLDKLVHSKVLDSQKQFAGWSLINQHMEKIRQGTNKQLSPINFVGIRSPMIQLRSPLENSRLDIANSPLSAMNVSYDKQTIGRSSFFEEEAKKAIKQKLDFDEFKKHVVNKSYHQQVFKELNIKGQSKL